MKSSKLKKNVILLLFFSAIVITTTSCTSSKTEEKNNPSSFSSQETETKSETELIVNQPTTSEEETTDNNNEEIIFEVDLDLKGGATITETQEHVYDAIINHIDEVLNFFNNKTFHKGDVFNVKEDLANLNYDVKEYGLCFSLMYGELTTFRNISFTYIEETPDLLRCCAIVDEEHNLIQECNTDFDFKFVLDYDYTNKILNEKVIKLN